MVDAPSWKCVCEATRDPRTTNLSLVHSEDLMSTWVSAAPWEWPPRRPGWGESRPWTPRTAFMLQLDSTHPSWTRGHSCSSMQTWPWTTRQGKRPCKCVIPGHRLPFLSLLLPHLQTSSCLTLNDWGGAKEVWQRHRHPGTQPCP